MDLAQARKCFRAVDTAHRNAQANGFMRANERHMMELTRAWRILRLLAYPPTPRR